MADIEQVSGQAEPEAVAAPPVVTQGPPAPAPTFNQSAAPIGPPPPPANQNGAPLAANDNAAPQPTPPDWTKILNPKMGGTGPSGAADREHVQHIGERAIRDTDSINSQQAANTANAQQQAAYGTAVANQRATEAAKMQSDTMDIQNRRAVLAKEAKDMDAKTARELDDMSAQKVDPNHLWHSMDTGQHILAGIGMGLSIFGGAKTGRNSAMDTINEAINRDVDAQKTNLKNHMDILDRKGALRDRGIDRDGALLNSEYEAKFKAYNFAQDKLNAISDGYKSPAVVAQAQQLNAQLEAKKNELADQYVDAKDAYHKTREVQAAKNAAGAQAMSAERVKRIRETTKTMILDSKGAMGMDEALARATKLETGVDVMPGMKETNWTPEKEGKEDKQAALTVNLPNGKQAIAASGPAAEEYRKKSDAISRLESSLATIKALRDKHGGGWLETFSPADTAIAKKAAADATNAYTESVGFNRAPSDTEQALIAKIIPSNPSQFGYGEDARADSGAKLIENLRAGMNRAYLKNPEDAKDAPPPKDKTDDVAAELGLKKAS